jgi:hypothetical protein
MRFFEGVCSLQHWGYFLEDFLPVNCDTWNAKNSRKRVIPGVRRSLEALDKLLETRACGKDLVHVHPLRWIVTRVACGAIARLVLRLHGRVQTIQREIGEGISFNVAANLLNGLVGRNQLALAGCVHAVKAG